MSSVLIVLAIVLAALAVGAVGVFIGFHLKEINAQYRALRSRVANLEEDGGMPDLAIVDAKTPKQVREEAFDEPDEESAIIVAKKPADLRRERDRKLDEELNRYGR